MLAALMPIVTDICLAAGLLFLVWDNRNLRKSIEQHETKLDELFFERQWKP